MNYKAGKTGKVDLVVYNKSGLAIFKKSDFSIAGNNVYNLNLSNVVAGTYYLEIKDNDVTTREKFILSK